MSTKTPTPTTNTLTPTTATTPTPNNNVKKIKSKKKLKSSKKILQDEHVRVAIRVRPFNSREKRKGCSVVVSMANKQSVTIWNEKKKKKKTFNFDYCYWSTNNDNNNGFIKQSDIFADLGHLYVDNAFKGFNSSVFAYGQTGSGKTYTMLGTAKNPGLIPRGCEEIFRRIEQEYSDGSISIEVEASYLEVYMDKIFDLLSNPDDKKKKKKSSKRQKLAIRFHPKKGPYVQGLTKHAVGNYRDIQKLMNVGLANRTVAETQMNKISSRSHCIFTLYMNQYNNSGAVITSKINLIDLAGSERVNKTGVMGQRMEELKKINKSLSALGDVIAALADNAKFIPYNNSVLTTLLSESLGGNSKTIMMAAISPADDNFDESLSTLRYADRVKKIKQIAKKNKGDNKATVERELRQQINKLKSQLVLRGSGNKDHVNQLEGYLDNSKKELKRIKMQHSQKVNEMRTAYSKMKKHLESMGLTSIDAAKNSNMTPKLINISSDPSLSGSMVFFITNNEISIGAANSQSGNAANIKGKSVIKLQSNGDILDKHAIIRCIKVKESKSEKALSTRLYVWNLLFTECDNNKDGFLNKLEFNSWSKQVLQRDDFNGFTDNEYNKLCIDNKLSKNTGISWDVLRDTFAKDNINTNANNNSNDAVDKNIAEMIGIPKKRINDTLMSDLKTLIFDDHNCLTVKKSSYNTVIVDFQYDLTDSDLKSLENEIKEHLESTKYGQNIQFLRPNDPAILKYKPDSKTNSDIVEKVKITIESANPTNQHIMIFVNKERITYNQKELHHGDHILLGTRHIFQFINPMQAGDLNLDDDKKINNVHKQKKQKALDNEKKHHQHVGSIMDMKNIMTHRMQTNEFRVGNMDITTLQQELLKNRQADIISSSNGGFRKLRDAFMEDYQVLTSKCNNANQMSLSLDKQVLFDIGTIPYFNIQHNNKSSRIIVTRTCHYSDPELQLQQTPHEFETLLRELVIYHELSMADGENVAAETLNDDPFIPNETETLLGEAKLKLSARKISTNLINLPINTESGDNIGSLTVEITFKLINKNNTNCYDFKQMENELVQFIIGFEKIETVIELQYLRFTFCGVGKDIVTISNNDNDNDDDKNDDDDIQKSLVHLYEDSYEVPEIKLTPSFRNYLSTTGITFKIWAPVFDNISQMPPVIAYKLQSKKVTIKIILPDGDILDLLCKTGNKIGSIKRKIEFRTDIADYQQKLYLNNDLLDNIRTLLDYNITNGSQIKLDVDGTSLTASGNLTSSTSNDNTTSYDARTSLIDITAADFKKELTNPNLSRKDKGRIRRLKNQSIHMAFLKEDLINPSTMTLESYQQENIKLREQLSKANIRIEQLERQLASIKSKSSGKQKNKVFGSWRRNKNKNK